MPTNASSCMRVVPAILSAVDLNTVQLFKESTTRDKSWRYFIVLPKKFPTPTLGESRATAYKKYQQNRTSLQRKSTWEEFQDHLIEYVTLDHAEFVPPTEVDKPIGEVYYLRSYWPRLSCVSSLTHRRSQSTESHSMTCSNQVPLFILVCPPLCYVSGCLFHEIGLQQSERD